ncbi:hypothetical protein PV11_09540 [Exophiala sideris]|uniref:Cytochrome b5 heme-binding domain-containing protein n=1 Tax=Exophiala sideris TaxID=1016849 RepID=A0A0D1YA98_9EURO|nr:hypothetical protein PV11_09540 [Exophiala sideris]
MADPFSIIGLAAVAAHSLHKTMTFIDSIRGAPSVVQQLSTDLNAIDKPLRELSRLSESAQNFDPSTRTAVAHCLRPALVNCQQTCDDINALIGKYVRSDGQANRNTWKRLAFSFHEHKVEKLQTQLAACKTSLNVAAHCAGLLIQSTQSKQTQKIERAVNRIQRHWGIATSSVGGSDSITNDGQGAFKQVKQWISETETVIEEETQHYRETGLSSERESDNDSAEVFFDARQETTTEQISALQPQKAAQEHGSWQPHPRDENEDSIPSVTMRMKETINSAESDIASPQYVKFTRSQVAQHSTRGDTYVIIHNRVFDISAFVEEHPGGKEVLLDVAGQDASEAFEDVEHSVEARKLLASFEVGKIKHPVPVPGSYRNYIPIPVLKLPYRPRAKPDAERDPPLGKSTRTVDSPSLGVASHQGKRRYPSLAQPRWRPQVPSGWTVIWGEMNKSW